MAQMNYEMDPASPAVLGSSNSSLYKLGVPLCGCPCNDSFFRVCRRAHTFWKLPNPPPSHVQKPSASGSHLDDDCRPARANEIETQRDPRTLATKVRGRKTLRYHRVITQNLWSLLVGILNRCSVSKHTYLAKLQVRRPNA